MLVDAIEGKMGGNSRSTASHIFPHDERYFCNLFSIISHLFRADKPALSRGKTSRVSWHSNIRLLSLPRRGRGRVSSGCIGS